MRCTECGAGGGVQLLDIHVVTAVEAQVFAPVSGG